MNNFKLQADEVSTISFVYYGSLPLAFVMDFFWEHKVLDVYLLPTFYKNHQAFEVNLLCLKVQEAFFIKLIKENFTRDFKVTHQQRYKLWREFIQVEVAKTPIQVKCAYAFKNGEKVYLQVMPEYEDCKKLAERLNRPVQEVYEKVRHLVTSPSGAWQMKNDR
jgi:uncharacterized protein (DUF111 family)